jgi:hypothetical protein
MREESTSAIVGIGEHSPRPRSARQWSEEHRQVSIRRSDDPASRETEMIRVDGATPTGSYYVSEHHFARPEARDGQGVPFLDLDGVRGGY